MQQRLQQIPQLRQELRLSQTQIQSLEILQLPTPELETRLREETEKNPFLEIEEKSSLSYDDITTIEEKDPEQYYSKDFNRTLPLDLSKNRHSELPVNIVSVTPSLKQHLIKQLRCTTEEPRILQIGEAIIANIDRKGYLSETVEDLAQSLNVGKEEVEKVLEIIQSFEPPGVGARNLKECLLIQAKILFPDNFLLIELLDNHYDEFINSQKNKIAKNLKITLEEVENIYKLIKENFNPHPGYQYPEPPEYIFPDLIVKELEDGKYTVELVDEYLPKVKLVETLSQEDIKKLPSEEKEKVKEWKETAKSLIRSIELRKDTLLKVGEEIVRSQEGFMKKGPSHLKPMTYKDIAQKLGVHESTISRCIAGKWIATPQGIYELKFFFTRGLESAKEGETVSAQAIKNLILEIVNQENKAKPLSDEKIAEMIEKQLEVKIARRTVAKYREELKIPNSSDRKRIQK
ncbi:MAG: RNA polymerase factor sigma-54 [Candidatus Hydrogenedentes bacterium]|nr:RNA polymerase factor sigma-54 [Candidatus Hydrogenedentota bacterium]